MVSLKETQYHPIGILILYNRVLECISHMCETYNNNLYTSHVACPNIDPKNEEGLELALSIFESHQPPEPHDIKENIEKFFLI